MTRSAALSSSASRTGATSTGAFSLASGCRKTRQIGRLRTNIVPLEARGVEPSEDEVRDDSYPTEWLREDDRLHATDGAAERLGVLLASPLANHVAATRVSEPPLLRAVLKAVNAVRRVTG